MKKSDFSRNCEGDMHDFFNMAEDQCEFCGP